MKMKKMQTNKIGLTIGIAAVALLVFTASAAAQTSINVESATVDSGDTFTINVTLSNTPAAGIGAYGFNISFDPTVVQVKEVTNLPGFGIPNWNNDTGWVVLGGAVYPGARDGIFGTITFEAIGVSGTFTTLDLTVDDLKDEDGNSITYTVTDGLVTVGEVTITSVTVESKTVGEGESTTINVTLSDTPAAGIGAYGFNISFDPTVVQVKEVTNLLGFGIPNWNNDTGWVVLGGAVYPGARDGIFGTITFEAIGVSGTFTTLDLTVDDLKDEDGNSITYTVTDGSITVGVPPEEVVINEFIPNPEGDDDAPMPNGEWIELYNMGDTDVNVSGWVLYDSDDTHELYITPENTNTGDTIVPASGWLVVYRDGDTDFSLNQDADEVRLYDGYPVAESTLIDEASYTSSTEGKSWARIPDGTGEWQEVDPTPGAENEIIEQADLIVTDITPKCGEIFANETNNINATIKNNGTADAGAFNVSFIIGEVSEEVRISGLAAGASEEVMVTDTTERNAGESVTITVTADCDDEISESNETNNENSTEETVVNNGYKGKSFAGVPSLVLLEHDKFNGSIVYTVGNSTKVELEPANRTTTGFDIAIPEGATVRTARLYVYWYDSWYSAVHGDADLEVTFNGHSFTTPGASYTDSKGFGSYNYPKGTYAYDVTSAVSGTGTYTATIENKATNTNTVLTGQLLLVVYEDANETEMEYWITEGCDLLKADSRYCVSPAEAIANVTITDTIDVTNKSARLITVVAQGNEPGTDLSFNEQVWEDVWQTPEGSSKINIDDRSVTSWLKPSDNVVDFRDTGTMGMQASNAILVVTKAPTVKGDINGDGEKDLNDAIYLAKHVLGWTGYEVIYANDDINGDGEKDLNDAIYLAKHVLGWTGYEEIN